MFKFHPFGISRETTYGGMHYNFCFVSLSNPSLEGAFFSSVVLVEELGSLFVGGGGDLLSRKGRLLLLLLLLSSSLFFRIYDGRGGTTNSPTPPPFPPRYRLRWRKEKDMRKTDRTSAYKKKWEEEEKKKTYDGALYVRTTVGRSVGRR